VFVARDVSLRRNVVVKVLPPELIAGVNVERFNREIELAAGLQHPHIVPVLAAGQMDGVPYYTMPFVDGESLRARLSRTGGLPMTEAIGYLRDVAKALAYAHERGVVHRDIKPDNVLISGGSATVTDFGIAKALFVSRTVAPGATLTQIGTSIGTPAYMSPEQAAGDPSTDHRADIYSFGCFAFELLAGRLPFLAKTPQRMLAQHMSEMPPSVAELRPDTPAELADLVNRCLSKEAEDRPQAAGDIVRVLETVTSGGGHSAMPPILLGGRGMLKKALVVYAVAFLAVAIVARAAIVAIGLPDWVFPGALVVMALGLPVILFTAYVQYATRKVVTQTPTFTPGGTPSMAQGTMATIALKASPHMSWRRTAVGGAWAVAVFVLAIGGYMLLRSLGIGPFGSLMASGALGKDEKLLVADFPNPSNDSTLGPVVTEAFRTALGQSQSVNVLQQTAMRDVLRRMQKPANTVVNFEVAREIASREGIRAVIDGRIVSLGGKYSLSVQLLSPQSGDELAKFTASAGSESDLLPTIDKLAKEVRGKIGESLKNVQRTPPLEQVTTASLDALKKYVQGSKAATVDGDFQKGTTLLEEAIRIDTAFAMAYRKLAITYGNAGIEGKSGELLGKAYAHRDRLSDAERYLVVGSYFQNGAHQDWAQAQAAYEQLLELQPGNSAALNNVGNLYRYHHQFAKAKEAYERAIKVGPVASVHYANLIRTHGALGELDSIPGRLAEFEKAFPTNSVVPQFRANYYWIAGKYDSSAAVLKAAAPKYDESVRGYFAGQMALYDLLRGKLGDANIGLHDTYVVHARMGASEEPIHEGAMHASVLAWYDGDKAAAVRVLEDSIAHHSLDSVYRVNDATLDVVTAFAMAGRPDRARAVLAGWEQSRKSTSRGDDNSYRDAMHGQIAFASGDYAEAVRRFQASDTVGCPTCDLAMAGHAYDLAGKPDSAIVMFNKYLAGYFVGRQGADAFYLAGAHKRLGELYEAKGDRQQAISHYTKFVELWKDADPQLQPKVTEVKAKIARLSKIEGK
jgi:eukaryotic-like serine/threonine-protein kinase